MVFSQGCAVFRHFAKRFLARDVPFSGITIIGGRLSELESGTAKYCCVARFTAKSRCGKTTRFRRIRSQLDEDGELVFPSLASAPHLLNVLAQAATSFLALRGNQIRDEGAAYKKIAYLPARRMLTCYIIFGFGLQRRVITNEADNLQVRR